MADFDDDDDDGESSVIDEIYDLETERNNEDDDDKDTNFEKKKWILGSYVIDIADPGRGQPSILLLDSSISTSTFLKFPRRHVDLFLREMSLFAPSTISKRSGVELMCVQSTKITIGTAVFELASVVLKTGCIRRIQRIWKRVMKERAEQLAHRRTTAAQRGFEIRGRWSSSSSSSSSY
jgi:hypothetical protein